MRVMVARSWSRVWKLWMGRTLRSTVAHEDQSLDAEADSEFFDPGSAGHGIGGVAIENLNSHRSAVPVAEQSVNDLELSLSPVPRVAQMRQRAGLAFKVAAREIVKHEGTFLEVSGGEGFFDARLTGQKPVHGSVEMVFVNVIGKGAFLSQGACEGLRPQAA